VVGVRVDNSRSDEALGYAFEPFRWAEAQGASALGPLPTGARHGYGSAVSRDGSVIAGTVYDEGNAPVGIYRWTQAEGMVLVSPGSDFGLPPFLNGDGSVLVGVVGDGDDRLRIFRWTNETGAVALDSGEGRSNVVSAVSYDGNVIVGRSFETVNDLYGGTGNIPFVWRSAHGLLNLEETLASAGVDLQGWVLGEAVALSGDGRVIVGRASCDGFLSAYRAVLP
jgi:uncharacterized membrane protein